MLEGLRQARCQILEWRNYCVYLSRTCSPPEPKHAPFITARHFGWLSIYRRLDLMTELIRFHGIARRLRRLRRWEINLQLRDAP
jgi:hypothetical protein